MFAIDTVDDYFSREAPYYHINDHCSRHIFTFMELAWSAVQNILDC